MGPDKIVWKPMVLLSLALCSISLAQYGGGSGSSDDPYLIFTASQLNEIGADPNDWPCHFKLMADIDLSDCGGTQWNIIGSQSRYFTGVFDGNGHTISNLMYTSDEIDYVGLFGFLSDTSSRIGTVMNLGVVDVNVQGDRYVGGLVGCNHGQVLNCYVTGSVSGNHCVGGLTGRNYHTVANTYGVVETSGVEYVGGLVGTNYGMLVNSYSLGRVSGTQYVGGLVGYGAAPVNSFWDIEASGLSIGGSGGGRTSDQMKSPETYIGWDPEDQVVWVLDAGKDYPRLAWEGKPGEPIAATDLSDLLTGSGSETDPYLVATARQLNAIGRFPSEWDKYFRLTGDIDLSQEPGLQWNMIGVSASDAFVGLFDGQGHTVSGLAYDSPSIRCLGPFGCVGQQGHVTGLNIKDADIVGGWAVGGLAGYLLGDVSDCSVSGVVAGWTDIGGLVGTNRGDIEDCRCDVIVSGSMIGGLVGANCGGDIKRSSAAGVLAGTGALGGLAGFNVSDGTISECTAEAAVSSISTEEPATSSYGQRTSVSGSGAVVRVSVDGLASLVGGLAGRSDAEISDCYAAGNVSGAHAVGGLVGYNAGPISRCYSTGGVSDGPVSGGLVGGGGRNHQVKASFWDIQTSGQMSSLGGLGRTTDLMRQASTYRGWNDGDRRLWSIDEGLACPTLSWEAGAGEPIPDLDALLAGSGTEDDPYQIATAQDLVTVILFPNQFDKCFEVTADLDLSLVTDRSFNGIGVEEGRRFDGQFDGQGYCLRGLVIDANSVGRVGLFGLLGSEAVVKDFHLIDCSVLGASEVGALAGSNKGTISGCSMTGTVTGLEDVGGLVGSNQGTISVCCAAGQVTGQESVGGLVGYTSCSSKISDSYAQCSTSGTEQVGGLIGYNVGVVTTCYATGITAATRYTGGLMGIDSGTVLLSYWDIDTSGQPESTAGIGLPTAQMKQAATYFGWNAAGQVNWVIDEGGDYPRLAWEERSGQWIPPIDLNDMLGGSGTEDSPYVIETADQIAAIGYFPSQWDDHFTLAADIDLSGCSTAGLNPIGIDEAVSFNGVFDGQGHRIINLTINLPETDNVGLFGWIGSEGCIRNLEMVDIDITGNWDVGGLAGCCAGTVEDCSVTGSVSGNQSVGGLAGYSSGQVMRCAASTLVTGGRTMGCLLGKNGEGTVSQSSAEGMVVSTTGGSAIGGLVGDNEGCINFCSANATVSGEDSGYVGGLVGNNGSGEVFRCYAHGFVQGDWDVGGLVGYDGWGSMIRECYATSFVMGTSSVGGLVGYGDLEDVSRSFWDIQRSGQIESAGGQGLDSVAMQDRRVYMAAGWDFVFADDGGSDIWSIPEVGGYPVLWCEMDPVPALPAFDAGSGTHADPYLIFDMHGFNQIGHNPRLMDKEFKLQADLDASDVKTCSIGDKCSPFAGIFEGAGHVISGLIIDTNALDYVGLFPYVDSHAAIRNLGLIDVTFVGKDYVGGLAGYSKGAIVGCCVTGFVSGNRYVGGVVGYNQGAVANSYSAASVEGCEDVGGLAGRDSGRFECCYAVGPVSGNEHVGGLVGGWTWTPASSTCFWDIETTGQSTSSEGLGKTTAEMQDVETFQNVGWDFSGQADGLSDVWALPQDSGYPLLWWQVDPLPSLPSFAGGTGTQSDPYLVTESDHLTCLWANPRLMDKSFRLTDPIDLKDIPFSPIGDRDVPFIGVFDGGGFSISGLWLEATDRDYLGLFSHIGPGGRVQNTELEDVFVSGHDYVGALTGQNDGTILDCRASGTVTGWSGVGGLVGWNRFGVISDCDASVTVSSEYGKDGPIVGVDEEEDTPVRSR